MILSLDDFQMEYLALGAPGSVLPIIKVIPFSTASFKAHAYGAWCSQFHFLRKILCRKKICQHIHTSIPYTWQSDLSSAKLKDWRSNLKRVKQLFWGVGYDLSTDKAASGLQSKRPGTSQRRDLANHSHYLLAFGPNFSLSFKNHLLVGFSWLCVFLTDLHTFMWHTLPCSSDITHISVSSSGCPISGKTARRWCLVSLQCDWRRHWSCKELLPPRESQNAATPRHSPKWQELGQQNSPSSTTHADPHTLCLLEH